MKLILMSLKLEQRREHATNVQVQIVLAPGAVISARDTPDPASGTGTTADPLIWNSGR